MTAPIVAVGTCDGCGGVKALSARGYVRLHYLPTTAHHPGKVRRRCPGSHRKPREVRR
jgi:hypothetical protein